MSSGETDTRRSVLIVEDEAFIALDLKDLLGDAGFNVVACVSSEAAALEFLSKQAPHMAILDFNLREETSVAIAERLDAMNVPYLFLSGQNRDVIGTEKSVIRKPFNPVDLIASVSALKPK